MKKIINGKEYNTEVDTAIAFYEVSSHSNSRYYFSERLYMTYNGEFYVHGTGGLFTQYAMVCEDGSKRSGEDIIPMPLERVKLWVMLHYRMGLVYDPRFESIIKVFGMR